MPKVLVVATSRKTRGGITSVVKAHETGSQWKKYNCVWIQTHKDNNKITKIVYYLTAWLQFLFYLPFCEIVHFHFSNSSSAIRKRLMMPVAKFFGKKVIAHFHAFSLEETILGSQRKLYEYLFFNADVVIVLSDYWKKALMDNMSLPDDKVKILYNPCPTVDCDKSSDIEVKNEILYAGTLNQRKGFEDMICAFFKIANLYPDWKIVFAGNGEIEKGKALAAELGISEQVEFLGWVSGEAKANAFRRASVFCLPSYAEGFPMAVLDAWAYGLPVITTPVGGIPDIAVDGKNVLLFNPGDIDALANQMGKIISNSKLRYDIEIESLKLAKTTFNINVINNRLATLYEKILTDN